MVTGWRATAGACVAEDSVDMKLAKVTGVMVVAVEVATLRVTVACVVTGLLAVVTA